jgi:hypothetical protein
MAILRDFEKRLEGAVEGFFARAFRSGLQPVELAKALQRYAGNYQQVGLDGVFVPNVYRVELAQEDMGRFRTFDESLRRELADVVRRTADERGWQLRGPVRVELREADHVREGTYEVRGKVEVSERQPAGAGAPVNVVDKRGGGTQLLPTAAPSAYLHVLGAAATGQRHALKATTIIGRLPECDITLADPSVSRRHARVAQEGDQWVVVDLGSTNGLRVNGTPQNSAPLRDGDRLELGAVRLAFEAGAT